jgi:Zn-dependent protease
MLGKWKIGSAFGINVYLHWSFWLLPAVVFSSALAGEGPGPLLMLALLVFLVPCIILHEFGHALAARCFGINTRDITMYPIGGVAMLERMSEKPLEEFVIAVAGPAVNVVLAVLLGFPALVWYALDPAAFVPNSVGVLANPLAWLLTSVAGMNVVLVLFNMIPAFPMDGGRVFRALLSSFLGHVRATRVAATVAAAFAILMIGTGLWLFYNSLGDQKIQGPMLVVVGGFVFLMGQRELQMVELRERIRNAPPVEVLPVRRPLSEPAPLDLRPTVTVYTWDNLNGAWVKDGNNRYVRRFPLSDNLG